MIGMTDKPASTRLLSAALGRTVGLRRVCRPATDDAPPFELAYVRSGPRTDRPTVVIPGGPGLGSVLPYRGLRARATSRGLDLIMVEHRGVGLSRADSAGRDLPHAAMRLTAVIDDVAAVLDQEGVGSTCVMGSSYGSYVAAGFGVRHPDRVAGMLLDSPLQSSSDLALERALIRRLFWDGDPDRLPPAAAAVRRLVAEGTDQRRLLDVLRAAYELGGNPLLNRLLSLREGRRPSLAWAALELYASRDSSTLRIPGLYEFDLVGAIAFRELHYAPPPDGLPLDPALTYAPLAARFPTFTGEPFDLPAASPHFSWPMVVLTGNRDVRTPAAVAHRLAHTAPDVALVELDNGHSCLESHPLAVLHALERLVNGQHRRLVEETQHINRLPRRGVAARLPQLMATTLRLDTAAGQ